METVGSDANTVDARILEVALYARGARIRRTATVPAPVPAIVRIVALPMAMIDDTVRVEIEGPAIATNVRAGIAPLPQEAAAEEVPEVRSARRTLAIAEAEAQRIAAAVERARTANLVAEDPSDEPPAAWSAVVAARRSIVALRAEREQALRAASAANSRAVDAARKALDAALDRERRASSARAPKAHEVRKHVDIELVPSGAGAVTIKLEYLVAAARWAPSYVARLDGDRVTVEVRAVVAQATGEDWTNVPLALSTAEPTRFAALPELAAQRIGRRQVEPGRSGFRAPPVGAEALYADFDRDLAPLREAEPAPETGVEGGETLTRQVWDDEESQSKEAFKTPPEGKRAPTASPPPAAPAKPMMYAGPMGGAAASGEKTRMTTVAMPTRLAKRGVAKGAGLLSGMLRSEDAPAPEPEMAAGGDSLDLDEVSNNRLSLETPAPRLDYGNLVMAPAGSPKRGKLIAAAPDRRSAIVDGEVATAKARIASLPPPPGCVVEWAHAYDYAYATDGAVDVRADGAWHSIAVTAKPSTAKLRHVAVPREQADVFRVAAIANPFAGPLLPGPIDVYDRGKFLLTSVVETTPPGATLDLGLGVDPAVKIARNIEFREEATGMLRGKLELHHAIAIDVDNLSPRAVDLEVRERIPVTREGDDDITVALGKVEPAWERWTPDPNAPRDERLRGGHRWRVAIPAGQKKTLRASYAVTIAGKSELVGGNRRES